MVIEHLTTKILATAAIFIIILIFRISLGKIIKRKIGELVGHQNLTNLISAVFSIALALYLLDIWGLLPKLVEVLTALGALGAVLLFTLKDIWISNVFAGISLIGDKSIDVGTEVEVAGKRGKIIEMTLTVTKVETEDGHLVMVPNKKFREDVVTIKIEK